MNDLRTRLEALGRRPGTVAPILPVNRLPKVTSRQELIRYEDSDSVRRGLAAVAGLGTAAAWGYADPIVFFDTETTGLAGGTGTVIFLAGWAILRGRELEVTQLVLEDHDSESPFLESTIAALGQGQLVTYNGASYDLPLLETRCILSRINWERSQALPHLDLLGPMRRLFRRRVGECGLGHLESVLLGRPRQGDIEGRFIPQAFYRHLDGDPTAIGPVLDHNRADLLAMVDMAAYLGHHLQPRARLTEHWDEVGRARHWWGRGMRAEALEALEWAWALGLHLSLPTCDLEDIGLELGRCLRAQGQRHQALEVLRELWSRGGRSPRTARALAVSLEHVAADPAAALAVVECALRLERSAGLALRSDLERRRQRLLVRVGEVPSRSWVQQPAQGPAPPRAWRAWRSVLEGAGVQ